MHLDAAALTDAVHTAILSARTTEPTTLQGDIDELLAKAGLGDRKAFRLLYERTSAQLFGVVVRILGRTDLAEEALQDAYVQIWNRASEFQRERAQATTWMTAIVRYRALDLLRKHGRERPASEFDALPEASVGPAPVGERADLEACLGQLSDDQQRSIKLAYVQGYSHQELSEKLAMPLGTIKSWIRRGLQSLKECLS